MEMFPRKHQGKIQGWFMAFTSLGGIAGPYVTGYLIENASSPAVRISFRFPDLCLSFASLWRTCMGCGTSEKVENKQ